MTKPRQIPREAPSKPDGGRDVAVPSKIPRRIVVRPDQIFQREFERLTRRSFEGVVARYVLISGAVVGALAIFALVATTLLGH